MIYGRGCTQHSHVRHIQCFCAHMRPCSCPENTERALTLSREPITHSAAYFWGSKDHTPLCACAPGHVLKMYQLTNTSASYIRKTNADLHPPKEHFRHLRQKGPERHKNRISFAIRWNVSYVYLRWSNKWWNHSTRFVHPHRNGHRIWETHVFILPKVSSQAF